GGVTATLVKLIRVAVLAPVVLLIALAVRRYGPVPESGAQTPPIVPLFVLGFLALAILNSFGLLPSFVQETLEHASRWALITAIVAVGIKTSLRSIMDVGGMAVVLVFAETVFIAALVLVGLHWLA
ncbi:MAG: putative sulfate exporter family transporter, partial [Pseudomonadota bacterium]